MPGFTTDLKIDDLQTQLHATIRLVQPHGEADTSQTCFAGNSTFTLQELSEMMLDVESIYENRGW